MQELLVETEQMLTQYKRVDYELLLTNFNQFIRKEQSSSIEFISTLLELTTTQIGFGKLPGDDKGSTKANLIKDLRNLFDYYGIDYPGKENTAE